MQCLRILTRNHQCGISKIFWYAFKNDVGVDLFKSPRLADARDTFVLRKGTKTFRRNFHTWTQFSHSFVNKRRHSDQTVVEVDEIVKMTVFWDFVACSLVEIDWRFRGANCLDKIAKQFSRKGLMLCIFIRMMNWQTGAVALVIRTAGLYIGSYPFIVLW
jgi:hypothetical protein